MQPIILLADDNRELVTLLTGLLNDAGYRALSAYRGQQALELAQQEKPSLAVIDMLLPDMMGDKLAQSLRAVQNDLPIVFISGVFKGARQSKATLGCFTNSQYFEKPFDSKTLLKHIQGYFQESTVQKTVKTPGSFDVELDTDVEEAEEQDPMELTGRIRVTGGGNISVDLQGAHLTASKPTAGPVPGQRPTGQRPAPLSSPSSEAVAKPQNHKPAQGLLSDNLPQLIHAFYTARETGELYCKKGKVKKVVYFENGLPVFALSNLAADRFGQFLVRVGKVQPMQLQDAAVRAARTNQRTGDILIQRGLLKDTERLYYIGQQTKAIIYSLFGWEQGQYVMTFREKARTEAIKLDVFPGNLIVRGIKKMYKPERLARLVRREEVLSPSQHPFFQLHEIELEKWEAALLSRLDGSRTNAEIIALSGKSEAQVATFIAAMLALQVVEHRAA